MDCACYVTNLEEICTATVPGVLVQVPSVTFVTSTRTFVIRPIMVASSADEVYLFFGISIFSAQGVSSAFSSHSGVYLQI